MKKIFVAVVVSVLFVAQTALAMTFQQPVEIGGIGFPIGAPYHGYVIKGATQNDGKPYNEPNTHLANKVSYQNGTAQFGDGADALYCQYVYAVPPSKNDDWKYALKFGGKNNYAVALDSIYKMIFKIDTDEGLTLYMLNAQSGTPHINIIGRQKDGKWVSYIDTRKISEIYFGGNEAYKGNDGVSYDRHPQFQGDTIIIPYTCYARNGGGRVLSQGEFRFKWNDAAQWFGVEQIIY